MIWERFFLFKEKAEYRSGDAAFFPIFELGGKEKDKKLLKVGTVNWCDMKTKTEPAHQQRKKKEGISMSEYLRP